MQTDTNETEVMTQAKVHNDFMTSERFIWQKQINDIWMKFEYHIFTTLFDICTNELFIWRCRGKIRALGAARACLMMIAATLVRCLDAKRGLRASQLHNNGKLIPVCVYQSYWQMFDQIDFHIWMRSVNIIFFTLHMFTMHIRYPRCHIWAQKNQMRVSCTCWCKWSHSTNRCGHLILLLYTLHLHQALHCVLANKNVAPS